MGGIVAFAMGVLRRSIHRYPAQTDTPPVCYPHDYLGLIFDFEAKIWYDSQTPRWQFSERSKACHGSFEVACRRLFSLSGSP